MDHRQRDVTSEQPARVVYTCWPYGGLLCGLSAIVIGVILLIDYYVPTAPEVLWGLGLIFLGLATMAWSHVRGDW